MGEARATRLLQLPHQEVLPDRLVQLFASLDQTHFHPHDMGSDGAEAIANYSGTDIFVVLESDGDLVAYGMLRGWDEGYETPSLGVAVRADRTGLGHGRAVMQALHSLAAQRGARTVRLRVNRDNRRAIALYESLGYTVKGTERGELVMTARLGPQPVKP